MLNFMLKTKLSEKTQKLLPKKLDTKNLDNVWVKTEKVHFELTILLLLEYTFFAIFPTDLKSAKILHLMEIIFIFAKKNGWSF